MKDQLEPISTGNIPLQNVTDSYGATFRINWEMGLESLSLGFPFFFSLFCSTFSLPCLMKPGKPWSIQNL